MTCLLMKCLSCNDIQLFIVIVWISGKIMFKNTLAKI